MADESAAVTVATPATVASVAPAATPAAETASPAGVVTPEGPPEVKPERTFKQDDVDRLIRDRLERQRAKHERETEELRQLALRNTQPPKEAQPSAPVDTAPKREDFTDFEEFVRADARYAAIEAMKAERAATEKIEREQAKQRERQTVEQAHATREQAATAKYSDYYDVTRNPSLPITEAMVDVLALSDDGPDIAYYLGKNPAEAKRIASLHPTLVAKELGALSVKIAQAPPTVTLSSAPAPIVPVTGTAPVVTPEPSDKDDMATWVKKREAQLRKRARASA